MDKKLQVGDKVLWHDKIGEQWLSVTITEVLHWNGRRYCECLPDGCDATYGKHYGWPEDFKAHQEA